MKWSLLVPGLGEWERPLVVGHVGRERKYGGKWRMFADSLKDCPMVSLSTTSIANQTL